MPVTAHVELKAILDQLGALADMAEKATPVIAEAVREDLRRSIDAGETPYGEPWQLTKKGKVPLRNAMKAVSVTPVGRTVFVRLDGIEARHQLGAVKGKIKRRIIPSKKRLPTRMAIGIRVALDKWFQNNVVKHAS